MINNFLSKNTHSIIFIGLLGAVLIIAYLPIFQFDYGAHNDLAIWQKVAISEKTKGVVAHPEAIKLFAMGRPLNAILHDFQFSFVDGYSGLWWSRVAGWMIIFISAVMYFIFCTKLLELKDISAFTLTILIHTVPSYQLFGFWTSNLVPGIFTSTIGIFAGIILVYGFSRRDRSLKFPTLVPGDPFNKFFGFSWAILFFGLLIYPPNAAMYMVPILTFLFFSKNNNLSLAWMSLFLFVSCHVVFYLFIKFLYVDLINYSMPAMASHWNSTNYSMSTLSINDAPGRITAFLKYAFPSMLGIGSGDFRFYLGSTILVALLYMLIRRFQARNWLVLNIFLMGGVILIVASGSLLAPAQWVPGIRNTVTQYSLLIIVSFYVIQSIFSSKYYQLFLPLLTCIGSIAFANQSIFSAAYNAHLEAHYIKNWAANSFDSRNKEIYVVLMSPPGSTISPVSQPIRYQSSEFSQMATNYTFMENILKMPLEKLGEDWSKIVLKVVPTLDQVPSGTTNVLNMNLAKLQKLNNRPPVLTFFATSSYGGFGPEGLAKASQPGWHVKNLPQILDIKFGNSVFVKGIEFLPQDGYSERMPNLVNIYYRSKISSKSWIKVFSGNLNKSWSGEYFGRKYINKWKTLEFSSRFRADQMRIEILGSTNGQDLVTFRGLRLIESSK